MIERIFEFRRKDGKLQHKFSGYKKDGKWIVKAFKFDPTVIDPWLNHDETPIQQS